MAITITQQPTSPNAAYTRLPYVVSGSTNTTQPQFEYVMDVYESGSASLITRVTQTINPVGVSVFDPSFILQGQLSKDVPPTSAITEVTQSAKTFDLKFGEQYGTSISSSVTVYPNAVTSSIAVIPAVVDSIQENSFNLNTAYVLGESSSAEYWLPEYFDLPTPNSDHILTNDPYLLNRQFTNKFNPGETLWSFKPIGADDYESVSVFNNQPPYGIPSGSLLLGVQSLLQTVIVELGDINNVQLFSGRVYSKVPIFNALGPAFVSGSLEGFITTIGTGPKNLYDVPMRNGLTGSLGTGSFGQVMEENPDWARYTITLAFSTDTYPYTTVNETDLQYYYNEKYNIYDFPFGSPEQQPNVQRTKSATNYPQKTCDDKIRFAFLNKWGVWDYYSIYNPVRRSSNIQRESVTLPQLNYSGTDTTFNINRRGQLDYYTNVKDRFVVETQQIDQVVATWLEELFESPSVFVQKGDDFIPVIITNTSYVENNSTPRNKTFTYTIEFEPANQPYGDWE